jgi:hypothetical protein
MTDAEFEVLVVHLEQRALRNPAAYRRKVILLACVGYAYVALMRSTERGTPITCDDEYERPSARRYSAVSLSRVRDNRAR